MKNDPIIKVEDLKVHFGLTKGIARKRIGTVKAVDGVSFSVEHGKTIGIVGASSAPRRSSQRTNSRRGRFRGFPRNRQ